MRLRNMSVDNFLFAVGISIMLLFIGYFGLVRLTSEVCAMWTFRIVLYSGLISGAGYAGVRLIQKLTGHGLRLELFRAHIAKRQNEAGYGVHAVENGLAIDYRSGQLTHFTKARPQKTELPVMPEIALPGTASAVSSTGILTRCDSVLICGGKGAGKTNLAFHLADNQLRRGCKVFVIDPKPQFDAGKWNGARVIGADHDYPAIISFLNDMTRMMKNDREQVRIWIDELIILNMRIKKFADLWLPVMIEGREYGKFISVIGQSKTAGSVGLEGRYDLTNCFDAIAFCIHNPARNAHFVEIDIAGEDTILADAPAKFRAIAYHGNHESQPTTAGRHDFRADKGECERRDTRDYRVTRENLTRLEYDPDMKEFTGKPRRFFESRAEKQAVEMRESGESLSKIAAAIFGSKSGQRVKQVKQWIEPHVDC